MKRIRIIGGKLPTMLGVEHSTAASLPPAFEFTFLCRGIEFKALQRGRNQHTAAHEAILELAYQCPDFEPECARMVQAVQVR